jgi:hypothetical protein
MAIWLAGELALRPVTLPVIGHPIVHDSRVIGFRRNLKSQEIPQIEPGRLLQAGKNSTWLASKSEVDIFRGPSPPEANLEHQPPFEDDRVIKH